MVARKWWMFQRSRSVNEELLHAEVFGSSEKRSI
jgi:hypothetical protein